MTNHKIKNKHNKKHNQKMSDIEARREARRKRILENSEKRLQKITGVEKRNVSYELEGYRSLQNDGRENVFPENLPTSNEPLSNSNPLPLELENIYRNSSINSHSTERSLTSTNNEHSFIKNYRLYFVIVIAFLVNVLLGFMESHDLYFVNKIFIPLLCFEAIDLFYNKNETGDDFAKYLIFFGNIPRHQLLWSIKYIGIIKTIFRDVMIYFFVFVCILYFRSILTNDLYLSFAL